MLTSKVSALTVSYDRHVLSESIGNSNEAYKFLMEVWDQSLINLTEQVYAVFLNDQNEVISWRLLNTGTSCESLFDVKLCLAVALGCMCSKMIIAHNHPSGNMKPSTPDINMTIKLRRSAKLMDITLADHLIVSDRNFYSFMDAGHFDFQVN